MLFNVFVLLIGVASARHLYEVNEQVTLTERNYGNPGLNPGNEIRNIQYHEHSVHQIHLSGAQFDPRYRTRLHPEFFDIIRPHMSRPGDFEAIKRNNEFINNKSVINTNSYVDIHEDARRRMEVTSQQSTKGFSRDTGGSVTQEDTHNAPNSNKEESEYYDHQNVTEYDQNTTQETISNILTNKNEQGHDSNKNSSESINQYKNTGQETMTSRKIKEPKINQANTSTAKSIVVGGPKLFSNKNINDTNSINNDDGVGETMWVWSSSDSQMDTTTVITELDNRDAFKGDGCPTDWVKVGGKCVTPH